MNRKSINSIYLYDINSLRSHFESVNYCNNIFDAYNKVLGEEDYILNDIVRTQGPKGGSPTAAFVRAGPRTTTHFDPVKVRAAIVTCGGLCPGLNNVIRELVHSLHYLYHSNEVYGIM